MKRWNDEIKWRLVDERVYTTQTRYEATFAAEVPGGYLYRQQTMIDKAISETMVFVPRVLVVVNGGAE